MSSPEQLPRDPRPRITPATLFVQFARLTLQSFGGALFWSRRMLVERLCWLSEQEFVETLAMAQLMPGANGVNMAVFVGYRFAGIRGAAAALAGFLGPPLAIIVTLGALYNAYGAMPVVQQALTGMAPAAVGLLIATAWKLTAVLGRRPRPWLFVAAAFAGVGVLRWPLLAVVAVLAPIAIFAAWRGRL